MCFKLKYLHIYYKHNPTFSENMEMSAKRVGREDQNALWLRT